MSAARGSLTRLPLGIFEDLLIGREYEEGENDALNLRATICEKLISFRRKLRNGTTTVDGIKTAASLLQLSIPSLVQALDPLLTYGKCDYHLLFFLNNYCNAMMRTKLYSF